MLPYRIIENLNKSDRAVYALGISGEVADEVSENVNAWVGIGQLQLARDLMREAGVRDVVIVGGVRRPNLTTLELDDGGACRPGIVDRILLPGQLTASVMFGGPDLDVMFVTTMGRPFWGVEPTQPDAGAVFVIEGSGFRGLPEHRFAG